MIMSVAGRGRNIDGAVRQDPGSVDSMREITLEGWSPYSIAASPAGPVWTTVLTPAGLARLSRDGEGVTLRELPAKPMLVAVGADGTVWHTSQDDRIGRDGESWYALPAGAAPYGVAADPDGGAYFSAPGIDRVGRVSAAGTIQTVETAGYPAMITVDDDGSAWVALNAAGKLARWDGGALDIVDLPAGRTPAAPVGVAAAGDRVWFADIAGGSVGLADRKGVIDRIAFADPACRPHAVAAAPDGGCWATLWGSGQLARVAADGAVTLFDLPGKEPHGLALVDDEVWVAMESGSVVRVEAWGGD
jgi:virginiamycin B lyase